MNVKEHLYRQPPDILYHYTTQPGLLGIIRTQEIWASHTQYLNDAREFRHAIAVVEDEGRVKPQKKYAFSGIHFLAIPSFSIRDSKVVGFKPSISAAPPGPRIRHSVRSSTRRI
jgi:hypothetical protein